MVDMALHVSATWRVFFFLQAKSYDDHITGSHDFLYSPTRTVVSFSQKPTNPY